MSIVLVRLDVKSGHILPLSIPHAKELPWTHYGRKSDACTMKQWLEATVIRKQGLSLYLYEVQDQFHSDGHSMTRMRSWWWPKIQVVTKPDQANVDNIYLDKKWTRDLSSVANDFEDAGGPKPPFDAVIHGQDETRFLSTVNFPPFLLALLPVASDWPPQTFQTRRNLSPGKPVVILCSLFDTAIKWIINQISNSRCTPMIL